MGTYKPRIVIGMRQGNKWAVYNKGNLSKKPTKIVKSPEGVFEPLSFQGPVVWAKNDDYIVGILHLFDDEQHRPITYHELKVAEGGCVVDSILKHYTSFQEALRVLLDDNVAITSLKLLLDEGKFYGVRIGTVLF